MLISNKKSEKTWNSAWKFKQIQKVIKNHQNVRTVSDNQRKVWTVIENEINHRTLKKPRTVIEIQIDARSSCKS
jgi:hypothetical protein